jgi:hypothetical protein
MQTTRRDYYGRSAAAGHNYPPAPPPAPLRLVKNTNEAQYAPLQAADPQWLEEAVLRILKKHSLVPAADKSDGIDVIEDFLEPSWALRVWRGLRAVLIFALIAGAAAFVVRWRYPVQARAATSFVRAAVARITVPDSRIATPIAPAPSSPAPLAPTATPAVATPVATTPVPAPTAQAPTIPALTKPDLAPTDVSSLPIASPAKAEARPAHATHAHAAVAPPSPPVAAPTPDPTPEPPASPSPIPGSLGDAIRRAGGVAAKTAPPVAERAPAPEPKSPSDTGLPDRPSASAVTSALLAALPDARACLNDGDETKAIVIFESSGGVSSVQVGGASAACIQKAFGHVRVPAFSQPTYRAGVPIRSN